VGRSWEKIGNGLKRGGYLLSNEGLKRLGHKKTEGPNDLRRVFWCLRKLRKQPL